MDLQRIKDSRPYQALTYDYTIKDLVSEERLESIQGSRTYTVLSDWLGLGINKFVLGMYIDSQTGLLPGTSLLARGISLSFHSVASPANTWVRNRVYRGAEVTNESSKLKRGGAEILAFNLVQTPLYVFQVGIAMGVMALLKEGVEFEPETLVNGAYEFYKSSWWLAFAGKFSMDGFRRFFAVSTPEELARESLEERLS